MCHIRIHGFEIPFQNLRWNARRATGEISCECRMCEDYVQWTDKLVGKEYPKSSRVNTLKTRENGPESVYREQIPRLDIENKRT